MLRVVFLGLPHHAPIVPERLRALEWIDLVEADDQSVVGEAAGGAEVLVITPNRYSDALEQAVLNAGRLKLVQLLAAGYDPLLKRRFPAGTTIATAGDALAPAVAEHALALTLALMRRLDIGFRQQAEQIWDRAPFNNISSLEGKTAAVVGFGAIGKATAARLRCFGVRIIGVSRQGRPDPAADEMAPISALNDVLGGSDIIVITLPGSNETEKLFDRARLQSCKAGAILVNVARGRIVDTMALMEALQAGWLGGAGLDVSDPEPLPAGLPLWHTPGAILTPHYGGIGGQDRVAQFVTANLTRLRDGLPLEAVVNIGQRV